MSMLKLLGNVHVDTSLVAAIWIAKVPSAIEPKVTSAVTPEGQFLERLETEAAPNEYEVIALLNTHQPTERVLAKFDTLFDAIEATKLYCNELNATWQYGGTTE